MLTSITAPFNAIDGFNSRSQARLHDGGLVVVWENIDRTVEARIYNADGSQRGVDMPISGDASTPPFEDRVRYPFVAVLKDGTYVVTYEEFELTGSRIFAKRFDTEGNPVADAVLLHTLNQQSSSGAKIVALEDGGYAITIVQYDGSGQGVVTQRFTADGAFQSALQTVNQTTLGTQQYTDIAATPSGGHAVVWASENVDGSSFAVMLRVYDANGGAITSEIQVNQRTTGNQNLPAVAALADGTIAVVWHSINGSATSLIEGQLFNADGSVRSTQFTIDEGFGSRLNPEITALKSGGFAVVWQNSSTDNILAAAYDALGLQIAAPQIVNLEPVKSFLAAPKIIGSDGNHVSIAWNDITPTALVLTLSNLTTNLSTNGDDIIYGGDNISVIKGLSGDDTLHGESGDDTIDGGDGIDTAVFDGPQSAFTLTLSPDQITITDRRADGLGTDQLTSTEFLDFGTEIDLFGDSPMNLDIFDGPASLTTPQFSEIIELYIAYFNRAPDALGLFYWATEFANGFTIQMMAENFFLQSETQATYASVLDAGGNLDISDQSKVEDFVTEVYANVLGRSPDTPGFNYWVNDLLNNPIITPPIFILSIIGGAKFPSEPTEQTALDQTYLATKSDLGAYFAVIKGMSDIADASAAMALFDGSPISIENAITAIDNHFTDALDAVTGDFLMPLVGVIDDPFGVV